VRIEGWRNSGSCPEAWVYSEIKLLRGVTTAATLLPSDALWTSASTARAGAMGKLGMEESADCGDFRCTDGKRQLADMRAAMALETDARIILGA
jgi:hypothetical protein